jgi:Xaa-Pro aminopeptidase
MVFTSEPGVYIVGEFGVRTEDVVLVRGVGTEPEVLSGRRAVDAWDP